MITLVYQQKSRVAPLQRQFQFSTKHFGRHSPNFAFESSPAVRGVVSARGSFFRGARSTHSVTLSVDKLPKTLLVRGETKKQNPLFRRLIIYAHTCVQ